MSRPAASRTPPHAVRALVLILLVLMLVLVGLGPSPVLSLAAQPNGCADVAPPRFSLIQDAPNLEPAGSLGNPELCLFADTADGVDKAIILFLDDPGHFDAAKDSALAQLAPLGIDPCSVSTWEGRGLQALTLSDDQRFGPVPPGKIGIRIEVGIALHCQTSKSQFRIPIHKRIGHRDCHLM